MDSIEVRLKNCEEEIKQLKNYKDSCTEKSHKTDVNLATAIEKMNSLIEKVEILPSNIEKIIIDKMEIQARENKNIYSKIENIEDNQKNLNEKVECLEKLLDERTVEEDSKNYKGIFTEILFGAIGFLVALVLGKIFK